jgi:hypothetical protein
MHLRDGPVLYHQLLHTALLLCPMLRVYDCTGKLRPLSKDAEGTTASYEAKRWHKALDASGRMVHMFSGGSIGT